MWAASGSSCPKRTLGARFWAAVAILAGCLVYAGLRWVPPREVAPPPLTVVDVPARVVSVTFEEPKPPSPPPKLNINVASAQELEGLPGIGPVLAGRIVAFREARGPFRSVEDLLQVSGIGPKILDQIRALVTVGDGP